MLCRGLIFHKLYLINGALLFMKITILFVSKCMYLFLTKLKVVFFEFVPGLLFIVFIILVSKERG